MSDLRRIDSLLPGLPGGRRDETAAAARAVWPRAAGEQVARNSHPIRMTGDVLVVHCTSSTWASELTMLSGQVLAALATEMGAAAPAGLRFEVGELPRWRPQRRTRWWRWLLTAAASSGPAGSPRGSPRAVFAMPSSAPTPRRPKLIRDRFVAPGTGRSGVPVW